MINNKLVTIIKENQFDKGWTIFSPSSFEIDRNRLYKKVDLLSITRLITFSNEVNLILSDDILPSRIVNELEWANKYININVIAKNKEVLKRYSNLIFNSCRIDETININYIGIKGKNNGFFILDNDLCQVDETIESLFFGSIKNKKYSNFENVKTLIVCCDKHMELNDYILAAKDSGIDCCYVVNTKNFNRDVYDFARKNELELFVSDYVRNAVISINKDGSICEILALDKRHFAFRQIENIYDYVGELYKNNFLSDIIETDKIPQNSYSCFYGEFAKLNVVDSMIVSNIVKIFEMSDFINEIFDKSIVDKHNDYSNKANFVKYEFTLIPPLFDSTYCESSLYLPFHTLLNEWEVINEINFRRMVKDYREFMNKDSKFTFFVNYLGKFADRLKRMINECLYKGFYSKLDEAINTFEDYQANLISDFSFMFNEVNKESNGTKFEKFDIEIEGYRKTIKEKETLVSRGIGVLSNSRRIEILDKKLKDLLALKNKFESGAANRLNKETDLFISHCMAIVNGASSSSIESIGKIVNVNEGSKIAKLNNFVTNYLKQLSDYLTKGIICLKNMKNICVPEEYQVFEKDNQKYIVIEKLSEYEATENLREEFSLKCLARR